MRLAFVSLLFLAPAAFAGAPAAAPPPPATPAAAPAPRNNMENCPSAVPGASTAVKDVIGGIEVTITGTGDGVAAIRARAKALVDASKATAGTTKHDGKGDGGGRSGRCPVVMFKTAVTSADVDGGAAVTVKADNAAEVDWLRKETRERVGEEAAANAGHGKMAHCPSALDGAVTQVTDSPDGVVVLVTGKGDVVKQIRERTTALLAAAAGPDDAIGHGGNGHGGGGFGRCPVVVTDTVLAAKDVDGGSQITVKAKPGATAALQKESHDRAARFTPAAHGK